RSTHVRLISRAVDRMVLSSSPTRRSSDLTFTANGQYRAGLQNAQEVRLQLDRHLRELVEEQRAAVRALEETGMPTHRAREAAFLDRKSTRLNSSHVKISYAVFCLKKKNAH